MNFLIGDSRRIGRASLLMSLIEEFTYFFFLKKKKKYGVVKIENTFYLLLLFIEIWDAQEEGKRFEF